MTDLPEDTIGGRIKALRSGAGMSINELAEATGISKSYLWNLENKVAHQRPSGETLYAIAEALNTTMSALLGRRLLTDTNEEVDETLARFAKDKNLPETDLRMLASIRWRGDRPRTIERWEFVYNALKYSRGIDRET